MPLPVLAKQLVHRDNLIWLLLAQAFAILPLLFYLPVWLIFFWLCAIFWRIQIHRMKWGYPNLFIKMILCVLCIAAIYVSFHSIKSVEPMISFLVCAFVLKTVELHSKKDALIVLFIGFIAIACQFLFAQDIAAGAYGIFSLFVLLSAWQAAFFSKGLNIKTCLQSGAVFVLQSIPFMVVLFVIMPRLGPLWSVPIPHHQGKTGFGDTLKIGDIANLVRSQEVAFRVSFDGAPPKLSQLYWRGLLLDHFDGYQWSARDYSSREKLKAPSQLKPEEGTYQYSIVLEPHSYRWLFSLKAPIAVESTQLNIFVSDDSILASQNPVTQKSEYTVISRLDSANIDGGMKPGLTAEQWQQLTLLPAKGNERSKALARSWRRQYQDPSEIVNAALDYYRKDFSYTLQPTLLASNAVDQFLFETKNGFCEHFSSSFVLLMRSSGIPARIVLGYQGASYNGVDDYFVVRQSDAHAWAEVWMNNRWQMVDPTNAVAPSRVSLGIDQSLSETDLEYLEKSVWQSEVLSGLYQRWDAMGYAWNRWVLNYDQQSQEGLLKKLLGSTSPWRVGFAFVGLCAFIFTGYLWFHYLLKKKKIISRENRIIYPILKKMERRGYVREPNESVIEFAQRISTDNPTLGQYFSRIAKAYTLAAYNGGSKNFELLLRAVRQKHGS